MEDPVGSAIKAGNGVIVDLFVGDIIACIERPNPVDCGLAALEVFPPSTLEKAALKILSKGPKLERFMKYLAKDVKKKKLKDKEIGSNKTDKPGVKCPGVKTRDSFAGSTQVLMSDGSTKRIDEIKAGDEVKASVPGDEEAESHVVEKVIVTEDDRDFVDLEIATSKKGRAPPQTGELTTTYHHPFYSPVRPPVPFHQHHL